MKMAVKFEIFFSLLVLAAVPPNMALDGLHVLAFMQNFAPHINKHLAGKLKFMGKKGHKIQISQFIKSSFI